MILIISKQIINLLLKNTKLNSSIVLIIIQRSFSLIKKTVLPKSKKKNLSLIYNSKWFHTFALNYKRKNLN
ncbi:hypothetical protein SAMN05444355_101596 [Flavobacterium frigoris]|uniref:Uncharacterized protein n=1 Tax=Flavobacterium frigoris TaxID=229204 RepID=A0A1H9DW16_FLAFI|nr:hypothetical protein SAMN05444355_101596 [Flavobacterium frigoris]